MDGDLVFQPEEKMSKNLLRILILITGVITAAIHLGLGISNLSDRLGPPFILNGLSYLLLVAAVVFSPSFLRGRERLMHYILMGFAALTIVLWFLFNQENLLDPVGIFTKVDELLLILFTWLHLRAIS
jgi:hypothetical protein